MHPLRPEYVDGPRERGGHRGDEDGVAPVLEFFDDEPGNEGILDFHKGRFPHPLLTLPRDLLGETSEEVIAGHPLEHRPLHPGTGPPPDPGAEAGPHEEADQQDEEEGEDAVAGHPVR